MELAKEREIIEDVMRTTREQRRVFQQELEELEEKNLVALQEVQLERLSLQLTQKGAFDGDTLSDKVLRQIKRQGKKGASKDKKKTSHGESLQEEVTDILTLKELESVPDIDALHEYGEDDDIPDHLPDSFVIGSPVSTLMFLESLPIVAEGKVIVEGKKLKRNDIARYLQKYTKLADVFRLMSEAASYQEHDFDEKKFTEAMHLLFGIVKQEHMKFSVARVLYTVAKEWCGIPQKTDTMYEKMLHDFSAHIDEPIPTSSHTIRRLLRFIAGTSRD